MKPEAEDKSPGATLGVGGKGANKRKPYKNKVREWNGPVATRSDRRWNGEPMRGYGSNSNDD